MNTLQSWLEAERGRAAALARHIGTNSGFVSKMAKGQKPVPVEHAAPIEAFTEKQVTRQMLFPNDWQRIWPELAVPSTESQEV